MFLVDCVKNKRGQVLIVSVVIVGVISLLVASTLMLVGLSSLRGAVTAGQSIKAMALNNGCAEQALYYTRQSPSYTGSDSYALDNGNCPDASPCWDGVCIIDGSECLLDTCLFTISDVDGQKKIELYSVVNDIVKKMEIFLTINNNKIIINSWQDVP
jgi:hypothetical protein